MRTHIVRSLVVTVALVAGMAGMAGTSIAQENGGAILNSFEVRQLVARGEPGDNARLAAHFSALANRYTAEAERHLSMAQSFGGNPSRNLATGMSTHCKRLAELNTQAAVVVRELSAYHDKLASGAAATPPRGGARFQAGEGAPQPTMKELEALAAKAGTPAEHRALEEYFLTLAKRYTTEANEHTAQAGAYRGTRLAQAAMHHDHLAALSRDAAKEAAAAAAMHKELAKIGS